MKKRRSQVAAASAAPDDSSGTPVHYDAETLSRIALKVKAEGFAPAADLKAEFGAEAFTRGIALLFRDFRMFREVRRPWGESGAPVLGYEWADQRFSAQQAKKVEAALGFSLSVLGTASVRPRYGDFEPVAVRCRWTAPLLGSVPVKDAGGDPTNVFERDALGNLLILRYHQRAMATVALPMIGKEAATARRIGFSIIRIPSSTAVKIVEHGLPPAPGQGGTGKGLRRSECIADGIEFTIRAMVPTSVLKLDEFLRMLRLAGQHVGLSPGRSAGFGDFEVLGAE